MTNRWAVLALLFTVRTCMGIQFQSVPAVSPLYLRDLAVSVADIGLLIGLYHAPGIALAVPGGGLGRRFGDLAVVAFGLVLMLAGALVMALSTSWTLQIAGRVLAGIGGVLLNVLMSKMVTDWFAGREIATAMGIFVNSWPVGVAVGLVLFPFIAAGGGLLAVQISVSLLITIALIALVVFYRPPAQADASAATGTGWPTGPAFTAVLIAGLIWGFYNAALGVVFGFGPLMLTERGWSLASASAATSVVLWVMAAFLPFGGLMADRLGRHVAIIVVSCATFAVLLLACTRSDWTLVVFGLMGVLGGMAAGPIMSLPSRVLAPQTRALGMGLFFTMFYVLQAAGPWIAGRASAYFGTARAAFDTGAVFLALTIALVGTFLALTTQKAAVPEHRQAQP